MLLQQREKLWASIARSQLKERKKIEEKRNSVNDTYLDKRSELERRTVFEEHMKRNIVSGIKNLGANARE